MLKQIKSLTAAPTTMRPRVIKISIDVDRFTTFINFLLMITTFSFIFFDFLSDPGKYVTTLR